MKFKSLMDIPIGYEMELVNDGRFSHSTGTTITRGHTLAEWDDEESVAFTFPDGEWAYLDETEIREIQSQNGKEKGGMLKYKVGDRVVLGVAVHPFPHSLFTPGTTVTVIELCNQGSDNGHYTVVREDDVGGSWWVDDLEIDHVATEALNWSVAGLPPVGARCVVHHSDPHEAFAEHVGKEVEIIAHSVGEVGLAVAVYRVEIDGHIHFHGLVADCFIPLPQKQPLETVELFGVEYDKEKLLSLLDEHAVEIQIK